MDRATTMINCVCAQVEKSRHERLVAVRLQAVARGFLMRHATRKLRVTIQPALLAPDHHLQSLLLPPTLVVALTTPTRGLGKSFQPQELPVVAAFSGSRGSSHNDHQGRPTGYLSLPMGSRTLSAPSSTTITAARGQAGPQGRGRCHGQPIGCHDRRADSSARLSL